MVNSVPNPIDDSVEVARQTIEERVHYRQFYERISNDLLTRISNYIAVDGDPTMLDDFSISDYTQTDDEALERKRSLIGLYSPAEGKCPRDELERLRKNNGLIVCPSCGELGRPRTLDHYLPKDIFPELSFTLVNLTPMCDWCQGEKGTDYVCDDGKIFIHPYFDDVNRPLIKLRFTPPYEAPVLDIEVFEGLDESLSRLVERHLSGIDFENRYKNHFSTAYRSVLRAANSCREGGRQSFRDCINLLIIIEEGKGINSWDAILYRSVLADDSLMNFLENETLPEFL